MFFLKKWAILSLFFGFLLFQYIWQYVKFADDWIRTVDLWCQKRPLYQLSHNHCPLRYLFYSTKDISYTLHNYN